MEVSSLIKQGLYTNSSSHLRVFGDTLVPAHIVDLVEISNQANQILML